MTELDKDVIVALADNRMNINDAAKALFICHQGVRYRIEKSKKSTGLDPKDFHDLCVLYAMVCEERGINNGRYQVLPLLRST